MSNNSDNKNDNLTISYPLIYSTSQLVNPNKTSSFVNVNPLSNTLTYGNYIDLDKDTKVQKTVSKYFLYKLKVLRTLIRMPNS
jgi:hypothetical protein